MASIQKSETLVKRIVLANVLMKDRGLAITPLLVGPHGIGKTQILNQAAAHMNGYCFTVEASAMGEGEITGLPFAAKAIDGSTEVRFVKYYQINKIWQLEKYYYELATTKGFLNGSVKLVVDKDNNQTLVEGDKSTKVRDQIDLIQAGEDNIYKFGEELSPETKLKLIESGEIKPVLLFIDELNRTELQTMKEMMNIILNKTVNGYNLPWWVFVVAAQNPCSQNSTYATNELDDAQLDRFLKIKVDANIEEWTDYALEKGLNSDVVEGIVISDNIFIHREKGQEDMSELSPSPRSWEMVAHIYDTIDRLNETSFFDAEERKDVKKDLRTLIIGKVGDNAGRVVLENIDRKENNIKPAEILTGKEMKVAPAIVEKFNRQKRLTQKIIADQVVNFLANNWDRIEKGKTSADEKKKAEYMNYMSQLKEFTNMLDTATQIIFVKKILKVNGNNIFFTKVCKAFSKEILENIYEAKNALKDLNKD